MITSDHIGKVVTFETYANSLIGATFNRCKVRGIVSVDIATLINDVATLAVAIYPSLPQSTNKDYRQYRYVHVQLPSGKEYCIAMEWIKSDTIEVFQDISASFTVNGINASDVDRITRILATYNYTDVSVKVLE